MYRCVMPHPYICIVKSESSCYETNVTMTFVDFRRVVFIYLLGTWFRWPCWYLICSGGDVMWNLLSVTCSHLHTFHPGACFLYSSIYLCIFLCLSLSLVVSWILSGEMYRFRWYKDPFFCALLSFVSSSITLFWWKWSGAKQAFTIPCVVFRWAPKILWMRQQMKSRNTLIHLQIMTN